MELETHFQIAQRLDYLTDDSVGELLKDCGEVGRMLNGLSRGLRSKQAKSAT